MLLQPAAQRLVDRMAPLEQLLIHLLSELDGVAAVAQHRRPVRQHGRLGGGAGKAGEPCDPFGIPGQILAAMLVGTHQHEPVRAALAQHGAEPGQPLASIDWAVRPRPQGRAAFAQCGDE